MNQMQTDSRILHREKPHNAHFRMYRLDELLSATFIKPVTFSCLLFSPRGSLYGFHQLHPFHLTSSCIWPMEAPTWEWRKRAERDRVHPLQLSPKVHITQRVTASLCDQSFSPATFCPAHLSQAPAARPLPYVPSARLGHTTLSGLVHSALPLPLSIILWSVLFYATLLNRCFSYCYPN